LLDLERRVHAAEEAGFHSVWLMDHLHPPRFPQLPMWEGLTTAAYLAAKTSRIGIGHLVLCNELRHPAVLAKSAVTLDHLSGGRFVLGIGWGSWPAELRTFGVSTSPAAVRSARLRETLEILKLLCTGETVSYRGEHFTVQDAQQLPRPINGQVPLLIGGAGQTLTLPLVARFADWWNCPAGAVRRIQQLRPMIGRARISVQRPVGVAWHSRDVDAARELAERRFPWGRNAIIAGTPDELVENLLADAADGVEMIIMPFADRAAPETLRRFGTEIIPAVHQAARTV